MLEALQARFDNDVFMQSMMALPTNGELEKQVLLILKDQKVHELYEVKETISKKLNLSKEELHKVSPIKNRVLFDTRVVSSLYHLKKGLIINEKQGVFKITKEGLNKFKENNNNNNNTISILYCDLSSVSSRLPNP